MCRSRRPGCRPSSARTDWWRRSPPAMPRRHQGRTPAHRRSARKPAGVVGSAALPAQHPPAYRPGGRPDRPGPAARMRRRPSGWPAGPQSSPTSAPRTGPPARPGPRPTSAGDAPGGSPAHSARHTSAIHCHTPAPRDPARPQRVPRTAPASSTPPRSRAPCRSTPPATGGVRRCPACPDRGCGAQGWPRWPPPAG
ncbi:hypothetical protein DUGA2_64880 [Duganella sp. HH101]|nr:hypothetical protein DUGA2_64880 [Duganella sp. HH101]